MVNLPDDSRAQALLLQPASSDARVAPDPLLPLLQEFFESSDSDRRAALVPSIERAGEGSFDRTADALSRLSLWEKPPADAGRLHVSIKGRPAVNVEFRLPASYDPLKSWPLALIHVHPGQAAESAFQRASRLLGDMRETILVAPPVEVDGRFHQPDLNAIDTRALIRELRRAVHVDENRVLLFGQCAAGNRAWMTAMQNPDLFAAAIVVDGQPHAPYPNELLPLLLQSLSHLPVINVRTSPHHEFLSPPHALAQVHEAILAEYAGRLGFPIQLIKLETDAANGPAILPETIQNTITATRTRAPKRVSHWFRYPRHGRAHWLSATVMSHPSWNDEQISILPGSGVDRSEFITAVFKERLYYIGANIEGQTIDISTKGCAEIEIDISADLVDLAQPVLIRCNGVKRHEGVIRPSIRALLNRAYERWEFSRPVSAVITLSVRRDGVPP